MRPEFPDNVHKGLSFIIGVLIAALVLTQCTGCANLTPREETFLKVGVTALAVGAVIVYKQSHGHHHGGMASVQKNGCGFSTGYCAGDVVGK